MLFLPGALAVVVLAAIAFAVVILGVVRLLPALVLFVFPLVPLLLAREVGLDGVLDDGPEL